MMEARSSHLFRVFAKLQALPRMKFRVTPSLAWLLAIEQYPVTRLVPYCSIAKSHARDG